MDEMPVVIARMESKIDLLKEKMDSNQVLIVTKLEATANDSRQMVALVDERMVALGTRIAALEGSLRRAWAFVSALAVVLVGAVAAALLAHP